MNDDERGNETPPAFTDLPLNVIFRVLSYLDLKELQSIARCCKLLRILANENLILTNNSVDLNSRRDQWTRRLIFDVFDIFNGSRNVILRLTTAYNLSVVESIRIVQKNYGLGYRPRVAKGNISCPESFNEEVNGVRSCYSEKVSSCKDRAPLRENTGVMEKETMTYLKILQGFHNIALSAQQDPACKGIHEGTWEDSENEIYLDEEISENDQDTDSDVQTPTQPHLKETYVPTKRTRTVSPTSSDYSKSSANSLFSELPPKLSSRGWHSSIYELEHVSDNLHSGNSDDGGSSSSESIVKLRNSNKVKDKAALFEKLISNDYTISGNQMKLKKKKSYGTLAANESGSSFNPLPTAINCTKRNISQGYLEELERCNLLIAGIQTNMEPAEKLISAFPASPNRLKNMGLAKENNEAEFLSGNNSGVDHKIRTRRLQRSKLKAFVTEGNKICYEKL